MKPRIFIGSSVEHLNIAYAIQANLDYHVYCEVWSDGVFELSKSNLESLVDSLDTFDFAIFVLFPEDLSQIRGEDVNVVRDNVIFELGLFYGKLGRNRVFHVIPRGAKAMHLPSDLLGIVSGTFDPHHPNLNASLQVFCNQVVAKIEKEYIPKFPIDGLNGTNILSDEFTDLKGNIDYSLLAITPNNFPLTIRIKNNSISKENNWYYKLGRGNGWVVMTFDHEGYEQLFKTGPGSRADMQISFENSGNAIIEYYKGESVSPFKTKEISWAL